MQERLRARYLALAAKTLARTHIVVHRLTRGRLGCHWHGGDIAFITTTGRRTGRPHTTPLACIHHRDGIAVVASNGGSYRPPDWWLNLQNQPLAEVELAGTKHAVVARMASPTEQAPLTHSFGQAYPRFERYRQRSRRALPVVVLTAISRTRPFGNALSELRSDARDRDNEGRTELERARRVVDPGGDVSLPTHPNLASRVSSTGAGAIARPRAARDAQ
jgi:deazaflavin-dependent oxidoreductase (nitroreductase family)